MDGAVMKAGEVALDIPGRSLVMAQNPPVFGERFEGGAAEEAARDAGFSADLDPDRSVQLVSTGFEAVLLPLACADSLGAWHA